MTQKPSSEPARARPFIPLLEYQRADIESDARFRWNCWARQTGKSFTKSLRRILRGLARRRTQVLLSAGERQSRELMMKVRQHCEALKIATDFYDNRFFKDLSIKQLEIVLPGAVRIIGLPANPMTARGYTGDVFLDEFAMHAFDREIWGAMFPTLLRGDGELDVASTPKGRGNMFYALRENPLFSTSFLNLHDAIAQGLDVDAEQMRTAMGDDELYRQEFLCEFLDESTAFLTYEQIARCVDPTLSLCADPSALADIPGELFIGVDIGRLRDLTVIWVLATGVAPHNAPSVDAKPDSSRSVQSNQPPASQEKLTLRNPRQTALRTVAIFELSNAPFRDQFNLLSEVLTARSARRCCIDAGGLGMQLAEEAVERFGAHRVEALQFTPALKSQMAAGLRIAVESARIHIPHDERIVRDWHSIERTVSETGHFRLNAPRREGSHADRFWAAALAVHAADSAQSVIRECHHVAPMQFARAGAW